MKKTWFWSRFWRGLPLFLSANQLLLKKRETINGIIKHRRSHGKKVLFSFIVGNWNFVSFSFEVDWINFNVDRSPWLKMSGQSLDPFLVDDRDNLLTTGISTAADFDSVLENWPDQLSEKFPRAPSTFFKVASTAVRRMRQGEKETGEVIVMETFFSLARLLRLVDKVTDRPLFFCRS